MSRSVTDSPSPPYQRKSRTSRAGSRHIRSDAPGLKDLLADALQNAGERELTIQEAAQELERRRGKTVKESTVCGRLSELREQGRALDSGRTRRGNAGVACVVWTNSAPDKQGRSNET